MLSVSTYTVYTVSPFSTLPPTSTHSAYSGPTHNGTIVISDQIPQARTSGRKVRWSRVVKGMRASREVAPCESAVIDNDESLHHNLFESKKGLPSLVFPYRQNKTFWFEICEFSIG